MSTGFQTDLVARLILYELGYYSYQTRAAVFAFLKQAVKLSLSGHRAKLAVV